MTQEALKLALGQLQAGFPGNAMQILREALVQTEQEPVAMWDGKYQIEFGNLSAYKHGEHSWIPLYISPPQRTWVGLTDEERSQLVTLHHGWNEYGQAIEAKLKEKNT